MRQVYLKILRLYPNAKITVTNGISTESKKYKGHITYIIHADLSMYDIDAIPKRIGYGVEFLSLRDLIIHITKKIPAYKMLPNKINIDTMDVKR